MRAEASKSYDESFASKFRTDTFAQANTDSLGIMVDSSKGTFRVARSNGGSAERGAGCLER